MAVQARSRLPMLCCRAACPVWLVWHNCSAEYATAALCLSIMCRYVPDATLPNSAYYTTAKNAIDSLNTYAAKVQKSVPAEVAGKAEVDAMNVNIKKFVSASKEVPITVCPTSCLNVGSFYGASCSMAGLSPCCLAWWALSVRGKHSGCQCAGSTRCLPILARVGPYAPARRHPDAAHQLRLQRRQHGRCC